MITGVKFIEESQLLLLMPTLEITMSGMKQNHFFPKLQLAVLLSNSSFLHKNGKMELSPWMEVLFGESTLLQQLKDARKLSKMIAKLSLIFLCALQEVNLKNGKIPKVLKITI